MGSVVKLNTWRARLGALDACHRDIAAHLDCLWRRCSSTERRGRVDAHAQQE